MRRPKIKQIDPSVDMDIKEQKRDLKQIDKTILDNFYKLVHTQDNLRLTAAMSTFKILAAMKKQSPEKFNEHLNYCIDRLVTGLASSRALARRGYGTLLIELLKQHQFSTDRLLAIGSKKFGSISHETRDNLVAYYLLISIILESENYKWKSNKDGEYAEKMYKCLRQLKFKKSYFDIPVSRLLVRYYSVFRPHMESEDILERLAEPPIALLNGKHTQRKLESLFNDCPAEVLCTYLDMLINSFGKDHGSDSKKLYTYAAKQMTHLIRRPQMIGMQKSITKLAKFLVANYIFKYVDASKMQKVFWVEHDVVLSVVPLGNKIREALKTAYHATLDHIVSTCDAHDRLKMMNELVEFANDLITAVAVKFYETSGDAVKTWPVYASSLKGYANLTSKKGDPKILYPITGLYLFYGLQILEHGLDCKEQLDDLSQSAKDALKNDPSDGSWADVLTDQIIAILSATECNPWIRRLCNSIFGSLLPHISETSIDLICDVFKMPDEPDEDEEGDDDGSSLEGDDKSVKMDQDDNGDESDHDDDKMSTCEDEHEIGRKLEEAIKDSLERNGRGTDKTEDDEDEQEEDYLDDDQMMKLDSVIADMFKMNRVGKKNKKDPSFQLRCLDLVKKILQKKHSDGELIRKVLSIIVPYSSKCKRYKELRPIAEKISKMIANLPGKTNLDQTLKRKIEE